MFLCCLGLVPDLLAQKAAEDMSIAELIQRVRTTSAEQAEPYLQQIVVRLEEQREEGDEPLADAENNLLAQAYLELGRYYFQLFTQTRDEAHARTSLGFLDRLQEHYPEHQLNLRATLLELPLFQALRSWDSLKEALEIGIAGIDAGRFPQVYLPEWLETLSLVYAEQDEWERGLPVFQRFHRELLVTPQKRALAAIYLIQAYQALDRPREALPLLPQLSEAPATDRFDPKLNLALFKLGNQFSDLEEYSNANFLYFQCIALEDIAAFYGRQLEALNQRALQYHQRGAKLPVELAEEIAALQGFVDSLGEQESYTGPLKYHRAQNLERMGRRYDAFFAYYRLVREHPEHSRAELFHYSAFEQAIAIGYHEEAIELGECYLATEGYEEYEPAVYARLASVLFQVETYDKVVAHGKDFVRKYPEHDYGLNIVHFMGFSWLRQEATDPLQEQLGNYLSRHRGAPLVEAAHYWVGMSHMVEKEYMQAQRHFESVIENFPGGSFFAEASFRRAVCFFGESDYRRAEEAFIAWKEQFLGNHLRGEAEVFLGDLDAFNANVAEAMAHYREVERHTRKISLIDHAYFEGARLLEANNRFEDVIDYLNRYLERYADRGNLPRAVLRIGQAYEAIDRPEVMIEVYYEAIVSHGNNPEAEGIDAILPRFVARYQQILQRYDRTLAFLNQLLEDDAFRLKLADSRQALHMHRLRHPDIDEEVIEKLLRNADLRRGLGRREIPLTPEEEEAGEAPRYDTSILPESRETLEEWIAEFEALKNRLPQIPPGERLLQLFETAREQNQRTLVMRLYPAFDQLGITPPQPASFRVQDLEDASPATLAWMGEALQENEPELARLAIERVLTEYPYSNAVPSALRTRARLLVNDGHWQEAVEIYERIGEAFPTWPGTPDVMLTIADVFRENGRLEEALDRYLAILQVRDWRGLVWAETCLRIGKTFELMGELGKAHGYYERTYISYPQFPSIAGAALAADGRVLEAMDETDSARRVYAEFLALPQASQHPEYQRVRERYYDL
ncbi:MAG: tol-pal system YbgF family protein [Opitutales bacterium]